MIFLLIALSVVSISFHSNHKKLKKEVARLKREETMEEFTQRNSLLLGIRALTVMKYFAPKDVVDKSFIRIGRNYDGGYVMVDDFSKCEAAYSFGISDDVSWDLDIAKRGIDVFLYDHTIEKLPIQNDNFHFFKTGVCGTSGENTNLKTLEEILTENGHIANKNLILKIDIEGAEWEVFSKTPSETIENFAQIVVEFHGVNSVHDGHKFNTMLGVFEKLNKTHQVVHVHANNYGSYDIIGGVPLPISFEITYLRKMDNHFVPSHKYYPVQGLDMPNNPNTADIFLGYYSMFAD